MTENQTGYWKDLEDAKSENAKLRAELAALRTAPSDSEIEAWQKRLRDSGNLFAFDRSEIDQAVAIMRRAANAQRAEPAPSVVVPDDVRRWAQGLVVRGEQSAARDIADWILRLPSQPAAVPAQADAELQRLLDKLRKHHEKRGCDDFLFAVVEALARRLGAT